MNKRVTIFATAAVIWLIALSTTSDGVTQAVAEVRILPEFICTVRAYGGAGYDEFQRGSMKELGLDFVQGLVDFTWDHIERGDNVWKWVAADEQMDELAKSGLQVVEAYVVSRTLGVNLKGWVYFEYFSKTHLFEESSADPGLMTSLDQHKPPQPRLAWRALQTLIKTVQFFDYDFDTKISGAYNEPVPPFVYRFRSRHDSSERLWVAFSGWGTNKRKPVIQEVTIDIAPMSRAVVIDMLGAERVLQADSSGNVTATAGSSPIYLKAGE